MRSEVVSWRGRGNWLVVGGLIAWLVLPAWGQYAGGSGTAENPYVIETAEQMNAIGLNSQDWDKHFLLVADLDLSAYQGTSFHVIGSHDGNPQSFGRPFTGVFDGNGHTISHFTYVVPDPPSYREYVWRFGLFSYVNGEVRNLGLIYPKIDVTQESIYPKLQIGALAGMLLQGRIENCYVEGGWVRGIAQVGGLVGYNRGGTIARCYATCSVSRSDGGYFPLSQPDYLEGGFGGLVGRMANGASVFDSYATGTVSGDFEVGGLVGRMATSGQISRCYAAGEVSASQAGGLVGAVLDAECLVVDSFWDLSLSRQALSAGGQPKSTAEMQDRSLYLASGWDLVGETVNGPNDVWQMCSGRAMYPKLAYEVVLKGDFVDREGVDFADLVVLAENWLHPLGISCCYGDLNGDYWVDMVDLAILAEFWRQGTLVVVVEATLDSDPGWMREGQWQYGIPTGNGGNEQGYPDPTGGHTGTHVFGVNCDGNYRLAVDGPHYLTAGPFDCRGCRDVKLQFARWLNTDEADFVDATVEASHDGLSWSLVWEYSDTEAPLTEQTWRVVSYDIGAVADGQAELYIRWGYEVKDPEAWIFSGWNIDDVLIWGYR